MTTTTNVGHHHYHQSRDISSKQFHDPLTDIIGRTTAIETFAAKQLLEVQLPSVIAFLKQARSYPCIHTTQAIALHCPSVVEYPNYQWSLLKRMCQSSEVIAQNYSLASSSSVQILSKKFYQIKAFHATYNNNNKINSNNYNNNKSKLYNNNRVEDTIKKLSFIFGSPLLTGGCGSVNAKPKVHLTSVNSKENFQKNVGLENILPGKNEKLIQVKSESAYKKENKDINLNDHFTEAIAFSLKEEVQNFRKSFPRKPSGLNVRTSKDCPAKVLVVSSNEKAVQPNPQSNFFFTGKSNQENTNMSSKQKMSLNLNGTTDVGNNGKPATTSSSTATTPASVLKKTPTGAAKSSLTKTTPVSPPQGDSHHHHLQQSVTNKKTSPTGSLENNPNITPGPSSRKELQSVSFDWKSSTKVPKTPPVTPDSPSTYLEDDMNSVYSFATTTSGRSTMSCEHPYVALNGTTFSGRKMKYVVHCSAYADKIGPDYLTPTQRAERQIRRLKKFLQQARLDLEHRDSEIVRLTREVMELRLFKASLSSPDERSASSDAITVREAELKTSQDVSPIIDMVDEAGAKSSPRHIQAQQQHQHQQLQQQHSPLSLMQSSTEMQSSCADSGNFEDMTNSSIHSKDGSYRSGITTHDIACGSDDMGAGSRLDDEGSPSCSNVENFELQRQELIRMYEQKIEELIRSQDSATSEMKRLHNDKMEALLMKLAECNTRYADIVPDYEHAKERIRELETQLEDLQHKLIDHEEKQKKLYLHMYQKGQEAERIQRADQALEMAKRIPNSKVSVNELLLQLQNTQDELENIRASEECRVECGNNHALLTAKEAISLWVVGARKTIYKRLLEAQKNRTHVDPEVTLQFLKSAIYYFLTDKENSQGHLQAIESILEFTEAEKQNISKARTSK